MEYENKRECEIAENIKRLKFEIGEAKVLAGRENDEITLVGVTKFFPPEDIFYAVKHGIKIAGENRVQEFLEKKDKVFPDEWHLIGHLQKNKAKYVSGKVSLIHSADTIELISEINRQAEKNGAVQNILIQVNTSGEETKSGCAPSELSEILSFSAGCKNVFVKGLMTIAPLYVKGVTATLHFDNTHKLYIDNKKNKYDNISMDILSMGMSADYKEAILSGANMIRVGSAIFGKRNY